MTCKTDNHKALRKYLGTETQQYKKCFKIEQIKHWNEKRQKLSTNLPYPHCHLWRISRSWRPKWTTGRPKSWEISWIPRSWYGQRWREYFSRSRLVDQQANNDAKGSKRKVRGSIRPTQLEKCGVLPIAPIRCGVSMLGCAKDKRKKLHEANFTPWNPISRASRSAIRWPTHIAICQNWENTGHRCVLRLQLKRRLENVFFKN